MQYRVRAMRIYFLISHFWLENEHIVVTCIYLVAPIPLRQPTYIYSSARKLCVLW